MTKPTVFFSHSSRDSQMLGLLKELYVAKTGGAIEVFLSSDGESLPLGHNWVHGLQEALERARLMVVFVSPSAVHSSWLYFESGFAYSKDIRVVPVGILGVDLAKLPPPLSLLQGFNVHSEAGLDNLIAVTNDVFDHGHGGRFTREEYQRVVGRAGVAEGGLGPYGFLVDRVHIRVDRQTGLARDPLETLNDVVRLLDTMRVDYARTERDLRLFGMTYVGLPHTSNPAVDVVIDPAVLDVVSPIIEKTIPLLRPAGLPGTAMSVDFAEGVDGVVEDFKVTGRLGGTDVKLAGESLALADLRFSIERSTRQGKSALPHVRIELTGNAVPVARIRELVTLLFERRVLYLDAEP